MSNIITSPVVIKDLDCLRRTLAKFADLRWRQDQKKFECHQTDDGRCEHAIHMDGVDYEIGIVKRKDGQGYSLVWDHWGCGQSIDRYIGIAGEKLITAYQHEYLQTYAEDNYNKRWSVDETEDEQILELEIPE